MKKAILDEKSFHNFKRNPSYCNILEHVSAEQGQKYLDILRSRSDDLFEKALDSVFVTDRIGNPRKYKYNGVDVKLSPSSLRYVKVASDLFHLFGSTFENVVEIGCGYGGQCHVNDSLLNIKHATLFDIAIVNSLIRKYLNYTVMNGAYEVTTLNERLPCSYDLVISNYAFSELPMFVQQVYIRKVLANCARGYLTMNTGISGVRSKNKMSINELKTTLPNFECLKENPLTGHHNYIIVWGHHIDKDSRMFTRKVV